MKATEQYFPVVLFIMLYKVVLMHQSIPAAPIPPPGNCGPFACLVSPGGGALANLAWPGGRAFAYPRGFFTHWFLTRNPNIEDFFAKDQQFVADWIIR